MKEKIPGAVKQAIRKLASYQEKIDENTEIVMQWFKESNIEQNQQLKATYIISTQRSAYTEIASMLLENYLVKGDDQYGTNQRSSTQKSSEEIG